MNMIQSFALGMLKRAAVAAITAEGPVIKQKIKDAVAADGPGAIDRSVGAAEGRITAAVEGWGPKWSWLQPIRDQVAAEVKTHGDALAQNLDKQIAAQGPSAIDGVFDSAQAILIARINAL